MKQGAKTASVLLAAVALALLCMWANHDIGVSKNSLEQDARVLSAVKDGWQMAEDTSDWMSAMVFYPPDKSDHSFQLYVNRPGLSFGYFFRGGGSLAAVETSIAEFTVEGCEDRAFVSLNTQGIVKVEIDSGAAVKEIELDGAKPFAMVLPRNIGWITFLDRDGNAVEPIPLPL